MNKSTGYSIWLAAALAFLAVTAPAQDPGGFSPGLPGAGQPAADNPADDVSDSAVPAEPAIPAVGQPSESGDEDEAVPASGGEKPTAVKADSAGGKKQRVIEPEETVKAFKGRHHDYRSPKGALFRSLLLPGLGQWYARSFKAAAGYLAAEIGMVAGVLYYGQKIDARTSEHQAHIDKYFDPDKYSDWMEWIITTDRFVVDSKELGSHNSRYMEWADSLQNGTIDWTDTIPGRHGETVGQYVRGYMDTLKKTDPQQYFEVVGKYQSFVQGWNDATPHFSMENGVVLGYWSEESTANYAPYAIRTVVQSGDSINPVNDTAWFYQRVLKNGIREPSRFGHSAAQDEAERLRNQIRVSAIAQRNILFVLLANHIVSAIDAAIRANFYNQNLRQARAVQDRIELEAILFPGLTEPARGFRVTYRF
jgi:hypothetical protein